jgi:hypothetical protein
MPRFMDRTVALALDLEDSPYLRIGQLVFISNVNIVDRNLQIVDHLGDSLVQERSVLLFLVYIVKRGTIAI